MAVFEEAVLPISPVLSIDEARESGALREAGAAGVVVTPGGVELPAVGPFIPSLGRTPTQPAPRLGEHRVESTTVGSGDE